MTKMSETYAKLFQSILRSSIWLEDDQTVRVWVAMLALADRNGYVGASVGGLAAQSRVSKKKVLAALEKFLAPDEDSRSQEHEGRRIEVADRGWILLNYHRFRDMRDEDARRQYERDRKRDQRAKSRSVPACPELSGTVPARHEMSAQSRSSADQIQDPPLSPDDGGQKKRRSPRRPEKTPVDPNLEAGPEARAAARKGGVDLPQALAEFIAHARAEGRQKVDWQAALVEWLLRAPRLAQKSGVHASRPVDPDERRRARGAMFGDACDGFFGPVIQERARAISSNRNVGAVELVDELERGEHQRFRLKLALP